MAGVVLDAGPLIAADKDPAALRTLLEVESDRGRVPAVSAATVAEVWRGGPRSARLARLFQQLEVVPVDIGLARHAGELLARTGQSDPLDALVVALAARWSRAVVTDDLGDLEPLGDAAGVRVMRFSQG